ncbi:Multidrug resistance-associated ABC transporter [Mycena sanguinolenta]|uniref:Multidrug resistance-associated ABC transporter n=1 Tax=Mycena sanguinolenta TaxID=230812 RepID=A0A8H6Y9F3_9AGAR|nr:Multidrug resistance-associated ABC transporter [Mycena sanguinolenta]
MPIYQLEIATILAVAAVCSLALFVISFSSEPKIQLPLNDEPNGQPYDPFDVGKPEDRLDGHPIKAAEFWKQMKRRKIVICILIATLLSIQVIGHTWSIHAGQKNAIKVPILDVCYSLYLFCLGITCVHQVERHSEFMWQLTTLTTLPATLLLFSAITPDLQTSATSPLWFSRSVLSLYVILCLMTLNTPLGPPLHYPFSAIYPQDTVDSMASAGTTENVTGVVGSSPWSTLYFSYVRKVVLLGARLEDLEIADLPVVPASLRATVNYEMIKKMVQRQKLAFRFWEARTGSGATLAYQIFHANFYGITAQAALSAAAALLYYIPPFCLSRLISYLEGDPNRNDKAWGWFWVAALFATSAVSNLVRGQLWSLCTTTVKLQMVTQLNALLLAKTLVRRDVASFAPSTPSDTQRDGSSTEDSTSKAQIMTLMTADATRVGDTTFYIFDFIDAPIEIVIGAYFLYNLLGVSSLLGLAVTLLFSPFNHFAGKVILGSQEKLMKARDERIGLMNEILGAIRMIKFMAWERKFESRTMEIRDRELRYQRLTYIITVLWNAIWNASPVVCCCASFWHFAVVRQQTLTPSIAFTSVILFNELKFALSVLPNSMINFLQVAISLRRIEKYLGLAEVAPVPPLERQSQAISFQFCSVTWPQNTSSTPTNTPHKFILADLNFAFPTGELSLICGKLGSGKSLLLLALLGEAQVVAGQMTCPRSPSGFLASCSENEISQKDWLVEGMCAYVPQVSWLRNASIRQNILFHLPFDKERYERTLEACALTNDLTILEDGDETEIGELGVTLSGGQRVRVSLARAIYSRASILLLDDVFSAVDAHTAHHLFHTCLKGELAEGRTVILVSHHVRLCASGASFIVALDNGQVQFQGNREEFHNSDVMNTLLHSTILVADDQKESIQVQVESTSTGKNGHAVLATDSTVTAKEKAAPRKLIEEETRKKGNVAGNIWSIYIRAYGDAWYWVTCSAVFIAATLSAVLENGWLSYWSGGRGPEDPTYYITIFTILSATGLILTTGRWLILYSGSIHASGILYKRLLEAVLFADIRFHDTSSRGRVLNRFGKDFEGIDSGLSEHLGYLVIYGMSAITSVAAMSFVGGIPFTLAVLVIGIVFYKATLTTYVQICRDVQRLESATKSPIYSAYSENIAGVAVIRAFGASSKILRDVLRHLDVNSNAFYWTWGLNRWLSIRFDFLAATVMCIVAAVCILNKNIPASLAGLALAFSKTVAGDVLFLIRRWVRLQQSMVSVERVNEYCEIAQEPPEFMDPRPPASWPEAGAIQCQDLVIRYAPGLPAVLHKLTFDIKPGEKVGILGRTGSGKSTLALSFLRFVTPSEGAITIDGWDISKVGLADLRSKITIIPQDPTILSGTLRSTLDVFGEYSDAEIFEALRRVHLIPSSDPSSETLDTMNLNIFRNLDSLVSEGGENLSAGEKQLLCMARALLKRSKILLMDEATASVDYATDELIGKTISEEFAHSTMLTIAHRIRSVVTYDKIMVLDQGKIAEFDRPATLLANPSSKFFALCKATGSHEFQMLKKLAGL